MLQYVDQWPLLVLAPSSVRGVWVDELERWLSLGGDIRPSDFCVPRSGADVAGISTARVTIVTYARCAPAFSF